MRLSFIAVVLLASPLWGGAGAAQNQNPREEDAAGATQRHEAGSEQRRAALRQTLGKQNDVTPAAEASRPAVGRQLSPEERAELRRQLREQSAR